MVAVGRSIGKEENEGGAKVTVFDTRAGLPCQDEARRNERPTFTGGCC
jgi:hypothetical protein